MMPSPAATIAYTVHGTLVSSGSWAMKIRMAKALTKPVTLDQIKAEPRLREIALLRNSRLSVQPLGKAEFKLICRL